MKIKILSKEFHKGRNGKGSDMYRVTYSVTNKYFNNSKDVMWFLADQSSDEYIIKTLKDECGWMEVSENDRSPCLKLLFALKQ